MSKLRMAGGDSTPFRMESTEPGVLTGDEKADGVVARHPSLRWPLMSYGLCTGCGGGLTLRRNTEVRAIPFETILVGIRRELARAA